MRIDGVLSGLLQHEIDRLDGVVEVSRAIDGISFALQSQRQLLPGAAIANNPRLMLVIARNSCSDTREPKLCPAAVAGFQQVTLSPAQLFGVSTERTSNVNSTYTFAPMSQIGPAGHLQVTMRIHLSRT